MGTEAAVEVLIRRGGWLEHDDFLRAAGWCPEVNDSEAFTNVAPFVGINWALAAGFAEAPGIASRTDVAMLRLAITIASRRQVVSLDDLTGLDEANVRLVLTAIAHAVGWHGHGVAALVDGRSSDGSPAGIRQGVVRCAGRALQRAP